MSHTHTHTHILCRSLYIYSLNPLVLAVAIQSAAVEQRYQHNDVYTLKCIPNAARSYVPDP